MMLFWTMPLGQVRHLGGPFRFPSPGPDQMIGLCVVLALPILLVRRLPAAVFAAILVDEAALDDLFGARPWIVFLLLPVLAGHLAARRPMALSGAAARVVETKPEQTRQALTGIETTSRGTLLGLQRMLGALRRAEPDDAMPQAAPLAPSGSLSDVPRLAERTADAGVRVHVTWRAKRRPLPPEIELSAFRIIQESVTNVVRHSGARTCRVAVGYEPEGVTIEVVDDGDDGPGGPGRPTLSAAGGSGFGLPGMRERVSLLSGQFSAGRRPGADSG